MIIRKATKQDVSAIAVLSKELENEGNKNLAKEFRIVDASYTKKVLLERLAGEHFLTLVVEKNKKVVGYMLNRIDAVSERVKNMKQGKINEIYIIKKFRGKSVASQLFDEAMVWFKKNKCAYVQLYVYESNPAKEIYKKWGFQPFAMTMKKKL